MTRMKAMRRPSLAKHYAHRGFHELPLFPENSMAAFRRALDHGFPVEFDVHLTKDGILVVFHDDELERMTGVSGRIEDLDFAEIRELRLAGTDERIPALDELLDLYEDSGLQLLIEMKPVGGNWNELAAALCERLDRYRGGFVVESFDPRALLAMKKLRPDFIRGQLVQDFFVSPEGLPGYKAALLTSLAFNALTKPDFIAYRCHDRMRKPLLRAISKKGMAAMIWTIKTPEDYRTAVRTGRVPIFEGFDPDRI